MKVINLTPHGVRVILPSGQELEFPPSGVIARVAEAEEEAGTINGVPVVKKKFGKVENLPESEEATYFIVSLLVLSACKGRKDLLAPDTGATAVRDKDGRIIAVRRFVAP